MVKCIFWSPQCFYIPKCHMDQKELQDEVVNVKNSLDSQLGSTSPCFSDLARHPGDVILNRKYTLRKTLLAVLWPSLMLGGGALLVGLVKLTQCLAHLASQMRSESTGGRLASRHPRGKLYQLVRGSGVPAPT